METVKTEWGGQEGAYDPNTCTAGGSAESATRSKIITLRWKTYVNTLCPENKCHCSHMWKGISVRMCPRSLARTLSYLWPPHFSSVALRAHGPDPALGSHPGAGLQGQRHCWWLWARRPVLQLLLHVSRCTLPIISWSSNTIQLSRFTNTVFLNDK